MFDLLLEQINKYSALFAIITCEIMIAINLANKNIKLYERKTSQVGWLSKSLNFPPYQPS